MLLRVGTMMGPTGAGEDIIPPVISPEVQAVFDRMSALTQQEMNAIETFVNGLVSDGVYDNITEIYAPCLNGTDFLTGFRFMTAIVSENIPVHTPGQYIDFQNTSQHWLDPVNLDTFATLDGFMGAYVVFTQADTDTNSDLFGVADATQICYLRWRGSLQEDFNSQYNVTSQNPRATTVVRPDNDFIGFGLNGIANLELQPGGILLQTDRIRNATVPKVDCQWHGHNENGIPSNGNMTNCRYSLMLHSNIQVPLNIAGAMRDRVLQFLRDIGVAGVPTQIFITTESGDTLTTEAGDSLIT